MNSTSYARAFVFFLALSIRLVYVSQALSSPFHTTLMFDSKTYDLAAHAIIEQGPIQGGVYQLGPLYTYFLAAIHVVFGHDIAAVFIVQAIMEALACTIIQLLGERVYDARTGLTAGLMAAVYGPLVFYTGTILSEPVLIFVNAALIYLLTKAYDEGKPQTWALAGVVLGISAWGKSNILVILPLILAMNWLYPTRKKSRHAAAWLLVGALVAVAPITARNMMAGGIAPVTGNFGVNLYIGNNPKATGTFTPLNELIHSSGNAYYIEQDEYTPRGRSILEADALLRDKAITYMTSDPAGWAALMLRKAMLYVNAYEIPDMEDYWFEKDQGILGYMIPTMALIAPLGILGAAYSIGNRKARPTGIFMIAYAASFILFFVKGRFRITLILAVILFCAHAIWRLWDIWRSGKTLIKPAIALAVLMLLVNNGGYRADIEGTGMYNPYNNLGREYASLGQSQKALEYYLKAVEHSPNHYEAHNNLGEAYNSAGEYAKAEKALKEAVRIDSLRPYAHLNLGNTYIRTNRTAEAAEEYGLAIVSNPYYYEARSNLGTAYLARGEPEKAIREYEAAKRINPDDTSTNENLEYAYQMRDKMRKPP
ncbi:MAG: tetratricopeptide repeat protein [Candidatus Altiarchaeota archaeon]